MCCDIIWFTLFYQNEDPNDYQLWLSAKDHVPYPLLGKLEQCAWNCKYVTNHPHPQVSFTFFSDRASKRLIAGNVIAIYISTPDSIVYNLFYCIGHELPYSIKMNYSRSIQEQTHDENDNHYDITSILRQGKNCQFVLKKSKKGGNRVNLGKVYFIFSLITAVLCLSVRKKNVVIWKHEMLATPWIENPCQDLIFINSKSTCFSRLRHATIWAVLLQPF